MCNTEISPKTRITSRVRHWADTVDMAPRSMAYLDAVATELSVADGRVLMTEGDLGREAFFILEGTVSVFRDGEEIATLGAGDVVGETALLGGTYRNATVVSTSPCRIYVLTPSELRSIMNGDPVLADRFASAHAA